MHQSSAFDVGCVARPVWRPTRLKSDKFANLRRFSRSIQIEFVFQTVPNWFVILIKFLNVTGAQTFLSIWIQKLNEFTFKLNEFTFKLNEFTFKLNKFTFKLNFFHAESVWNSTWKWTNSTWKWTNSTWKWTNSTWKWTNSLSPSKFNSSSFLW